MSDDDKQREQEEQREQESRETGTEATDNQNAQTSIGSQVTPDKRAKLPSWMGYAFIGVIVVIILLVMIFSGGNTKTASTATTASSMTSGNAATLKANLQKLAHENQQAKAALAQLQAQREQAEKEANEAGKSALTGASSTTESATQTRAYRARQNAPTTVYTTAPPVTSDSNHGTTTATTTSAVFAGDGKLSQFGNQQTSSTSVSATRILHPRYTIASGEFMHAVLETAINSDLPGMVRAVISTPVYAYVGEKPLVPAGSRLIGQYTTVASNGLASNRVFIIWNRVILPNGITVQINSPDTDALGRSGQGADSVNRHFMARFGQAALLSIIGAGVSSYGVKPEDQFNSSDAYRQAIAQSFQHSAQGALQGGSHIKPTIHIYQGAKINVFVAHDLSFYQVLAAKPSD